MHPLDATLNTEFSDATLNTESMDPTLPNERSEPADRILKAESRLVIESVLATLNAEYMDQTLGSDPDGGTYKNHPIVFGKRTEDEERGEARLRKKQVRTTTTVYVSHTLFVCEVHICNMKDIKKQTMFKNCS